jgi:glucose/arabinose dehydrogenase
MKIHIKLLIIGLLSICIANIQAECLFIPFPTQLNKPWGVAIDSNSILYFADSNNHRILKIDKNGIVSRIAGNCTAGYFGNGGIATDAQLNYPKGLALDDNGNIYVADSHNNVIRKIDKSGIITTIAGNNIAGYSGDNSLAITAQLNNPVDVIIDKTGNIYIADQNNHVIRKINSHGIISTIIGDGIPGR